MAVYNVSFQLRVSAKRYEGLYREIKMTACLRILDSTWLISTKESVLQLFDRLSKEIESDDSLFISKVSRFEYEGRLGEHCWDWLRERV